jgi:hypothetical protein
MCLWKCYVLNNREVLHVKSVLILHLLCVSLSVFSLGGCSSNGQILASLEQKNSIEMHSPQLEGTYELVSETLTLSEPEQLTEERVSNEWAGLWLFNDGHFSETTMKKPHSIIGRNLTQGPREYGFEGTAGAYQVEGSNIELSIDLSIYPLAVNKTRVLQFRIENSNTLILTETFIPGRESKAKGQRVTILRRVKR